MSPGALTRIILHCDLDAFYPSCEIHRDPSLRDKPLIVGADPKNGKGRGVVTSCSYEARKFGVRSGMPISMAWKLCPQGVFVPPDFKLYGETSERVMDIMRGFADVFEQTSIDEAYMDVSRRCKTYDEAKLVASKLKESLKAREGLTVSVGISPSKSISVEQTFERDVQNKTVVRDALESLSREVHDRLLAEGLWYRTVGIKVRFEGFVTFTREKTHTGYSDDLGVIRDYVTLLFREFEKDRRKMRLVGVRLSDLKPAEGKQVRLG